MFSDFTTKIIIFTLQPKIPSRTKFVQTVNTAKSLNTVAGRKARNSVEPVNSRVRSWEGVLFWSKAFNIEPGTQEALSKWSWNKFIPILSFYLFYKRVSERKRSHSKLVPEFGQDSGVSALSFVLHGLSLLVAPSLSIFVYCACTRVVRLGLWGGSEKLMPRCRCCWQRQKVHDVQLMSQRTHRKRTFPLFF